MVGIRREVGKKSVRPAKIINAFAVSCISRELVNDAQKEKKRQASASLHACLSIHALVTSMADGKRLIVLLETASLQTR